MPSFHTFAVFSRTKPRLQVIVRGNWSVIRKWSITNRITDHCACISRWNRRCQEPFQSVRTGCHFERRFWNRLRCSKQTRRKSHQESHRSLPNSSLHPFLLHVSILETAKQVFRRSAYPAVLGGTSESNSRAAEIWRWAAWFGSVDAWGSRGEDTGRGTAEWWRDYCTVRHVPLGGAWDDWEHAVKHCLLPGE